jgi:hypothetical protein
MQPMMYSRRKAEYIRKARHQIMNSYLYKNVNTKPGMYNYALYAGGPLPSLTNNGSALMAVSSLQ